MCFIHGEFIFLAISFRSYHKDLGCVFENCVRIQWKLHENEADSTAVTSVWYFIAGLFIDLLIYQVDIFNMLDILTCMYGRESF